MRVRVVFLVAVVAALALLAVACGGGGEEAGSTPTPTPSATGGGELTAEQAIQRVLDMLEAAPDQRPEPSTATARRMTECEALDVMGWEGARQGRPPMPPSENPVWLVEVRGEFSGFVGYGLTPDPSPPPAGRFVQIMQVDGSAGGVGAVLWDERAQEGPALPRDKIIERALVEIDVPGNQADAPTVTATRTTYGDALDKIQREGAPEDIVPREQSDAPVWLVEVRGNFVDYCAGTPRPGRYLLILALDGFVESSGFVPDATATP